MKTLRLLVMLAAGMSLAGCYTRYSVRPSRLTSLAYGDERGRIVEHYQARNYGWYLFGSIPLVCGDRDEDNNGTFVFFSDQVRMELLTEDFNQRVRETNTRPACVTTLDRDMIAFEVPGLSIPLVLPYVLCYREVQLSALLLEKEVAP